MTESQQTPLHSFLRHPKPIALAHRGGAGEAAENTMAAFARAHGLGFRYLEIDVRASRDGQVVVFHDEALDRVTDRSGLVAEQPWSELRGARVHGREAIPLLQEVLEAWPRTRLVIEAKCDRVVEPLAEMLRKSAAMERVCVGSFSDRRTARLRRLLGPGLCTSPGRFGVLRLRLASLGLPVGRLRHQAAQVPLRFRGLPVVDKRTLEAAHRRGLQVQVWTVNEREEMEALIELGVDGIMTDHPSLLKQVLQDRGLWVA